MNVKLSNRNVVSPVKKPRICISEKGVTSVSISEVLLTDVAVRQLKALEELIAQELLGRHTK